MNRPGVKGAYCFPMMPLGRVSDVLNDERSFLPVEGGDGTTFALSKAAIRQVSFLRRRRHTVAATLSRCSASARALPPKN